MIEERISLLVRVREGINREDALHDIFHSHINLISPHLVVHVQARIIQVVTSCCGRVVSFSEETFPKRDLWCECEHRIVKWEEIPSG